MLVSHFSFLSFLNIYKVNEVLFDFIQRGNVALYYLVQSGVCQKSQPSKFSFALFWLDSFVDLCGMCPCDGHFASTVWICVEILQKYLKAVSPKKSILFCVV